MAVLKSRMRIPGKSNPLAPATRPLAKLRRKSVNMRLAIVVPSAIVALSLAAALYALVPASDTDKTFVGKVSQGGMYEVEASKVAEERATAPDVRDVAVTEVHDHTLVNKELKAIATKEGIPVAATLNSTFQERLQKLKSVSRPDFDAAYISDMEEIHDNDEKLFAQEATQGSDAFKSFAHQTDLIVKRHIGELHGLDAK
jgi:putative membrane protein